MAAYMSLAQAHPQQMTYEAVGKTVQGRDIILFRIGNPNGGRVLFDGAIHGTEAIGSELLLSYALWLLESNESLAKTTLQMTYTLMIPVVNTDKENYARKNANGVDLNRNFATDWERAGSTNPDSTTYRGPSALSEPESQTLVNAFKTYRPTFYVNLHMWADPYYAGCMEANTTYYAKLVSEINSLSQTRGITPFPYSGQFGAAGMAIGDAARLGITSFLIELSKDVIPLSVVQTSLLAKFIPVAAVLSQNARPLVTHPHDVAVACVSFSRTSVVAGINVSIDVTIRNLGLNAENLTTTVSVDNLTLTKRTFTNLACGASQTFSVTWYTGNTAEGSHSVKVSIPTVLNETSTEDNEFEAGSIAITISGDVNGDFFVNFLDLVIVAASYNSQSGDPTWEPNADLNVDNNVNMFDLVILASHYGESCV